MTITCNTCHKTLYPEPGQSLTGLLCPHCRQLAQAPSVAADGGIEAQDELELITLDDDDIKIEPDAEDEDEQETSIVQRTAIRGPTAVHPPAVSNFATAPRENVTRLLSMDAQMRRALDQEREIRASGGATPAAGSIYPSNDPSPATTPALAPAPRAVPATNPRPAATPPNGAAAAAGLSDFGGGAEPSGAGSTQLLRFDAAAVRALDQDLSRPIAATPAAVAAPPARAAAIAAAVAVAAAEKTQFGAPPSLGAQLLSAAALCLMGAGVAFALWGAPQFYARFSPSLAGVPPLRLLPSPGLAAEIAWGRSQRALLDDGQEALLFWGELKGADASSHALEVAATSTDRGGRSAERSVAVGKIPTDLQLVRFHTPRDHEAWAAAVPPLPPNRGRLPFLLLLFNPPLSDQEKEQTLQLRQRAPALAEPPASALPIPALRTPNINKEHLLPSHPSYIPNSGRRGRRR